MAEPQVRCEFSRQEIADLIAKELDVAPGELTILFDIDEDGAFIGAIVLDPPGRRGPKR